MDGRKTDSTGVPALVDASGLCSGQEVAEPGCLGGEQREKLPLKEGDPGRHRKRTPKGKHQRKKADLWA